MSDDDVAEIAKKQGSTRAVASMEKACMLDKPLIFAIGNAPTALVRLYELIDEGKLHPCGIIGVPVGFVNVVSSARSNRQLHNNSAFLSVPSALWNRLGWSHNHLFLFLNLGCLIGC